ncbi:MAG: hypothetical protein KME54_28840 [Tolypothrix brevis GSE-NOS-MK-07-07A]|jgi:hypothetical protein|nr:hypothetical protein [Tolypothrix brevis GSE-NOS-MK-07-07A]
MTKSGYQRLKEWRIRQTTGEEMPHCKMCSRPLKGKKSIERGICSYCYPKTPEGSKANKKAVEKYRNKI